MKRYILLIFLSIFNQLCADSNQENDKNSIQDNLLGKKIVREYKREPKNKKDLEPTIIIDQSKSEVDSKSVINKIDKDYVQVQEKQSAYDYQQINDEKNITQSDLKEQYNNSSKDKILDNFSKSPKKSLQKPKSHMSQLQIDFEKQDMIRKAKFLKKKYKDALARLDNWENRKEALVKSFQRRYSKVGNSEYAKKRAAQRKAKFYHSLDLEEQHIQDRVVSTQEKLRNLEDEFLYKFSISLDEALMGKKYIQNRDMKKKKIELIQKYLDEYEAWKMCWADASEFDKIQSISSSIERLFPESQLTTAQIQEKSEHNKEQMRLHEENYKSLEKEFKDRYGVSLKNEERAKVILNGLMNH